MSTSEGHLRVLLWNVCVGGKRRLPLIERIDADVMLLLGASEASSRAWADRWAGRWHCEAGLQLTKSQMQRPHGSLIASRWPLASARVVSELPKPERGLMAVTDHPSGPITLVGWGAPNAAGEGRRAKVDAYAHMTDRLAGVDGALIVGIDSNSRYDPPVGVDTDQDSDWYAEHRFLDRDAPHGLLDVQRALFDRDPSRAQLLSHLRPNGPLSTTYIRRPHGEPQGIAHDDPTSRDY